MPFTYDSAKLTLPQETTSLIIFLLHLVHWISLAVNQEEIWGIGEMWLVHTISWIWGSHCALKGNGYVEVSAKQGHWVWGWPQDQYWTNNLRLVYLTYSTTTLSGVGVSVSNNRSRLVYWASNTPETLSPLMSFNNTRKLLFVVCLWTQSPDPVRWFEKRACD